MRKLYVLRHPAHKSVANLLAELEMSMNFQCDFDPNRIALDLYHAGCDEHGIPAHDPPLGHLDARRKMVWDQIVVPFLEEAGNYVDRHNAAIDDAGRAGRAELLAKFRTGELIPSA